MIVVIAICSWIATFNHCAFAAVATKIEMRQTECPFHSKPSKQKEQPSQVQCCKILRAVVLVKAKDWARDDGRFCDVELRAEEFALNAHLHDAASGLFLDTGPPAAHSFAELILQRSLFAHAPPFLG